MSDYTPTTDFSEKDALPVDDPEKLILGSDLDVEFDALNVAIATKYDSSDIATQVQAEAGASNAVLMTPLRTAQYLGAGAGVVADLTTLTDPNADSIIFWDDSESNTTWLSIGTGLSISTTTLSVNAAAVDHDTLLNFVANEHIDHTSVTITAGSGLAYSVGGTDISASATLDLDINGLTTETTITAANDQIAFYDASGAVNRKAPIDAIVGDALGDGKWYRNATQSVTSTAATLVFNTADYDSLTRGTFSTSTGEYTAGSEACRIQVYAQTLIEAQAQGEDATLTIEVQAAEQAYVVGSNLGKFGASARSLQVQSTLSLAAGEVVRVRVYNDSTKNAASGINKTFISIIELA